MARILLVEDNPTNLELLRYLLAYHGHEVATARDGDEGVRLAQSVHPDIVLCDLRMPQLDGYGLLERVRADAALDDVIVIAVTAYSMPDDRRRVAAAGFDGHLTKPIAPEAVVGQVEGFISAGRTGKRSV
jgi:two-component system, cell cycle response regulator DivK